MAAETARAGRLPGRAGAGRLHRRHRRRAADDKIRGGAAGRDVAALGARPGRGGRARDHDDRPVPEGGGGARSASAAATFRIGGMAKGSGMIEPMMATMLGVRHDRCGGAAGAARPRAARGGRRHLQRDHRRRRVLDQRLRDAARQRRQRRRRSTRRATPPSSPGCARLPRARARHRARRRGRDQARYGHRHRRGIGGRGAAGGARRSRTRRS